jgi:hypothetical protein
MSHFSSTEIIERLTQKTSSKREEQQLREGWDTFLKQLDELKDGEVLNCDMLGSFYRSNGELGFRPAPVLSKEINYRYQGQPPVVISEGIQQELEKIDETSVSFAEINELDEESAAEAKATKAVTEKPEEADQSQEKADQEAVEKAAATTKPEVPDSVVQPEKAKESSNGKPYLILAATLLIALLIIYGVYYNQSLSDAPPEAPPETTEINEPEPGPAIDSDSASQEIPQATVPEATSEEESPKAADLLDRFDRSDSVVPYGDYGLMGEMQRVRGESYGIVVHSLRSRQRAIEQDASLYMEGYRTITYPVETGNGTQSWRVSVGQFETVEDAQAAADQLPEPYRSNYFITKFSP